MENKRITLCFIYLPISLLFFCFISFISCAKESEQKADEGFAAEQVIEKFSVTDAKNGKTNWTLESNSAQVLEKENKILVHKPVVHFYSESNATSKLVADEGEVNSVTYDMTCWGRCFLENSKGESLKTDSLSYSSTEKKIFTESKIVLVRQGQKIVGKGFQATPDLESIVIKNQELAIE